MKVLSIQQPWAWLIANGYKDVENRDWFTSHRGPVLIHSPQKVDEDFFLDQGLHYPTWKRNLPCGIPDNAPAYKRDYERGGIVGYAYLQKVVTVSTSPWFRGKYGFVLTDQRPVSFIPLRGQLGLFDASADVIDRLSKADFEQIADDQDAVRFICIYFAKDLQADYLKIYRSDRYEMGRSPKQAVNNLLHLPSLQ